MKNLGQRKSERVMYQFVMLDGRKPRHVELVALGADRIKAAYLLCTK